MNEQISPSSQLLNNTIYRMRKEDRRQTTTHKCFPGKFRVALATIVILISVTV